jgi:hypothetical protein
VLLTEDITANRHCRLARRNVGAIEEREYGNTSECEPDRNEQHVSNHAVIIPWQIRSQICGCTIWLNELRYCWLVVSAAFLDLSFRQCRLIRRVNMIAIAMLGSRSAFARESLMRGSARCGSQVFGLKGLRMTLSSWAQVALVSRKTTSFLVVLGVFSGLIASSASASGLGEKLQQEVEHLASSRFELTGNDKFQSLGKGEQMIMPVQLERDTTYAIVAACGEGCDHVEIALFDPTQNQLHRSPEVSDVVIITGPPQESGVHGIALSAPGCRQSTCQVGLVILKQAIGPPASTPEARATPATPQSVTAPPLSANGSHPNTHASTPSAGSATGAPPNTDAETLRIVSELVKLGVTVRDAIRAKQRASAAVSAPVTTDAGAAPGKPAGIKEPEASPRSPPTTPPAQTQAAPVAKAPASAPNQPRATAADCQLKIQQYYAAARTSGAPGTMPPLLRMYQYLQCNCGHPPSPVLPPCPR